MIYKLRLVTLLLPLTLASGQAHKIPRFEDFRVSGIHRGRTIPPQFGGPGQLSITDSRCFEGDPADWAKELANFAGHFVIQRCTCGSGCHYLFMLDALSGKVYLKFPFGAINVGPHSEYNGEEYRLDSSLLIVEGCIEGSCDCSKRYYNWSGSQFKLIRKQRVRMLPECAK